MELPLLSIAYLPPIEYVGLIKSYGGAVIEQHEHFVKQTYRNRAVILTANGPMPLIIPLKKGKNNQQAINEVEIDYRENWQKVHWRTMLSAYNGSPFFEFYADSFAPFYTQRYTGLFEFNAALLKELLIGLKIKAELSFTAEFLPPPAHDNDHRFQISPKETSCHAAQAYRQVFAEKFGFVPNLSAVDLLFNKGNRSGECL